MSSSTPRKPYDEYSLHSSEIFWRDRYFWLQEHGYLLRPRYHPDWTPSWKGTDRWRLGSEDGIAASYYAVVDARRIEDGKMVMLKRIDPAEDPEELAMTRHLSSEAWAADSENHCVPLYDVLKTTDGESEIDIMVLPYLFRCDHPAFDTFGEVLEFFRQIFEALKFLHGHRISHRDVKWSNIMMDAAHLYCDEYHPMFTPRKRDLSGDCRTRSRTKYPVKYYFIDFGLSKYYPPNVPPRSLPGFGGDKTVPEFKNNDEACDPFAVDVYCIGNAIREHFTVGVPLLFKPKKGFHFIEDLVADMTQEDPTKRPSIEEATLRLREITARLSSWKLRSRIVDIDENPVAGLFRSVYHWVKQGLYMAQGLPVMPRPV